MVPAERIELPTFGLQNRCTTAVLRRPAASIPDFAGLRNWEAESALLLVIAG
jgi:hypothetical protein